MGAGSTRGRGGRGGLRRNDKTVRVTRDTQLWLWFFRKKHKILGNQKPPVCGF